MSVRAEAIRGMDCGETLGLLGHFKNLGKIYTSLQLSPRSRLPNCHPEYLRKVFWSCPFDPSVSPSAYAGHGLQAHGWGERVRAGACVWGVGISQPRSDLKRACI